MHTLVECNAQVILQSHSWLKPQSCVTTAEFQVLIIQMSCIKFLIDWSGRRYRASLWILGKMTAWNKSFPIRTKNLAKGTKTWNYSTWGQLQYMIVRGNKLVLLWQVLFQDVFWRHIQDVFETFSRVFY